MTHETARQRAARHKRDPFRAAQIAPSVPVIAARCECGHVRLMHRGPFMSGDDSTCLYRGGCDCTEYREVP